MLDGIGKSLENSGKVEKSSEKVGGSWMELENHWKI